VAFADRVFAGRPDLRAAVTPDHPLGGKRTVLSSGWYEALLRDDVELVPNAADRATPTGLVDAAGRLHEVDAVVLATGFRATGYLDGLEVVGRGGRRLHEVWAGEPRAFLGLTVPGFPNFWMLYGPGTNGGLIMSNLQHQAAFVAKEIGRLRRGVRTLEVREDVAERFDRWLQRRIARTSFASTDNYFRAASGRVVTQWPDAALTYAAAALLLRRPSTWGHRRH
jgi:cation diffusion facilitator CzcD-associated flavoprotein CzcO